ncbi:MAG TPA: CoA-binding protein [Pseudoxanthomonas sp.]|nr:CoA-binding protein [Pseudoxanthomonas sp.]
MRGALIQDHREIDRLLSGIRRIAVLGIKPETHAAQPAHMIPAYLHRVGYEVIPVPVYYPEVTHILGKPVLRAVADIKGRVDVLNVFRKPSDLPLHMPDILKARPRTVWLQTGIRDDGFAESLLRGGIDVVQDQCLMVEHRRWHSSR